MFSLSSVSFFVVVRFENCSQCNPIVCGCNSSHSGVWVRYCPPPHCGHPPYRTPHTGPWINASHFWYWGCPDTVSVCHDTLTPMCFCGHREVLPPPPSSSSTTKFRFFSFYKFAKILRIAVFLKRNTRNRFRPIENSVSSFWTLLRSVFCTSSVLCVRP